MPSAPLEAKKSGLLLDVALDRGRPIVSISCEDGRQLRSEGLRLSEGAESGDDPPLLEKDQGEAMAGPYTRPRRRPPEDSERRRDHAGQRHVKAV